MRDFAVQVWWRRRGASATEPHPPKRSAEQLIQWLEAFCSVRPCGCRVWRGEMPMLSSPIVPEAVMLLKDKVAVITGGGRGIGRAITLKFAVEGAAVVVAARTKSEIEAVAQEVRKAGGRAVAVPADVSDEKQCEHLIHEAASQFGKVDILVNNAGEYGPVKPVEEITPAGWDRVVAVHLRGAFLLMRLVLPGMYARCSGVILNISSLSAKSAFGWGSPYASAKAGMLGLTRVAAAEAARKGVRVNAICPGPVTETKMSKDL